MHLSWYGRRWKKEPINCTIRSGESKRDQIRDQGAHRNQIKWRIGDDGSGKLHNPRDLAIFYIGILGLEQSNMQGGTDVARWCRGIGGVGNVGHIVASWRAVVVMGGIRPSPSEDYSPAALEVLGCRAALALAIDLNLSHICVASDCLEVMNNVHKTYLGEYDMIISKIKETTSVFATLVFMHESRSPTGEAHRGISLSVGRRVWFLNPPVDCLRIPPNITINR